MEDIGVLALAGRCVLVAEDEYLLAEELRDALVALGAIVVGPFASVGEVCEAIEAEPGLDAAILDINLRGELVYPAAERLRARGTPFLFATAYDANAIKDGFKDVPRALKPVGVKRIAAFLAAFRQAA